MHVLKTNFYPKSEIFSQKIHCTKVLVIVRSNKFLEKYGFLNRPKVLHNDIFDSICSYNYAYQSLEYYYAC